MNTARALVLAAPLWLGTAGAAGQDMAAAAGDASDTYGTAALTAHVVGSFAFQARVPALPLSTGSGIERFFSVASAFADATFMVPNGAQIESFALRACDSDPSAQVTAVLQVCSVAGGACAQAGSVQTGTAATPGCNSFPVTLAAPVIVDNATQVLDLQVSTGASSATTFSAVKVNYRLRVSPAPATATFLDVPSGHPFFRFVEALVASGITGGCGGGRYCVDDPVTRGQMAVFLATALGLHFPN
ncbi:MAG TPA: S-layer homology domain-containing protein [Vicinamibacteria bacterium]|nr:S-layer homology domain-containing protein [Vicinamibacteria bacterium]